MHMSFLQEITHKLELDREIMGILERVQPLYQKYGIKSVTMEDVSRALGVSKKTLYGHIRDKEELVRLTVQFEIHKHLEFIDGIIHSEEHAIEELIRVWSYMNEMLASYSETAEYDLKKYYPDLYSEVEEMRQEQLYQCVLNNIHKGKKTGLYRQDLDEEVIAKLHAGRLQKISDDELFTRNELISPKFFHEFMIYHIRGIASPKGIGYLEEHMDRIGQMKEGWKGQ